MKKKLVPLLVFVILFFLVGTFSKMKKNHTIEQVRVAYGLSGIEENSLDPASIETIDQALIIDNIYSHLVEYDDNGDLQAGLVKKFYWEDDTLVFEFNKKAKSTDNHYIDAEDAAVSIRRLLSLGTSTHSDLNFFLCNTSKIKKPFENCEAVYVKNEKLYLKVLDRKYKPYLLTSLASDDFAIIPKAAIDPLTLKIINRKITSGPYFIESASPDQWILKSNINHYAQTKESPNKIILVTTEKTSAAELFINDRVDIISTYHSIGIKKLEEIQSKVKEFSLEKTLGIKLYFLQFSPAAQKKTTREQRAFIAEKFRTLMKDKFPLAVASEETNTFFLDQSLGKLTKEQDKKLKDYLNSEVSFKNTSKPTFHMYKSSLAFFDVFRGIQEIDPVVAEDSPYSKPIDQRLDLFLAMTDTSFEGNLTLLGYNFNMGTFGLTREEGNLWIEKYLKINDPADKAIMLQELQFKALIDGVIFPLFKAPYTSVGRNGFSMPLSPLFASSHFWKIKKI